MKVAIVTSIKAPYRTLQFEEINRSKEIDITVYYTTEGKEDRNWEIKDSDNFKEIYLDVIKYFNKIGTLNKGLKKLVTENDIIFIGGYEKPTYIFLAVLCKIYKKKYSIIFDGISCNRITQKENKFKYLIKKFVIKNSSAIWGNGTVSKKYFCNIFNYSEDKIYNQYLTVDGAKIKEISKDRDKIRKELRKKYNISKDEKVLHYSGRLVKEKNIDTVIKALSNENEITLLITGGGVEERKLTDLANELGVKLIITGFIDNQELLFQHYFISDAFILNSVYEPWGLVVNEAMFAGLPIIVSNICGCSLDLVKNNKNGYIVNPYDINGICKSINNSIYNKDMGLYSSKIIEEWTFEKSKDSFMEIVSLLKD